MGPAEQYSAPRQRDGVAPAFDSADARVRAEAAFAAGQLDEAGRLYERLAQERPEDADPSFCLGRIAQLKGDFATALDHFEAARRLCPHSAIVLSAIGVVLMELGRLKEAAENFHQALDHDPGCLPALNNLGCLLLAIGAADQATEFFARVAEIDPQAAAPRSNLGRIRQLQGSHGEAVDSFSAALAIDDTHADTYEYLGISLRELGRHREAEAAFSAGLTLKPSDPKLLYNLTYALLDQNKIDDALAFAQRNVVSNPDYAYGHLAMGHIHLRQNRIYESSPYLRRAIELAPTDLGVLMNFGRSMESLWRAKEALAAYLKVITHDPGYEDALARCIDAVLSLALWDKFDEILATLNRILEADPPASKFPKILAFNLQALPIPYDTIARSARKASEAITEQMRPHEPFSYARSSPPPARLRVGYLLPYTWWHSLPEVLKPVIEAHDRSDVELFGYALQPDNATPFSREYRAAFEHFTDLSNLPPLEAARLIHDDGIQVLIEVSGHTNISCLPVLAHRPAPVQAHYLGYSITTGADFVDFLITDHHFMPPELAAANTERCVYLPDSFMIAPPLGKSARPAGRAVEGLPHEALVMANFSHPCKFEPEVFGAWMRILERVPRAVMWFGRWIDATVDNMRREAERRGVAPDRLIFADQKDRASHCARLSLADIALDTLHHGGGITSVDALSAGVPLLSVAGATPGARMGTTLLHAVGLPELVCADLDEYERRAVELAENADELCALRAKLRANVEWSPLFDVPRYARHLQYAYHAMWAAHVEGDMASVIDVPTVT